MEGSVALLKTGLVLLESLAPIIESSNDFGNFQIIVAEFFKEYENVKKKISIEEETFLNKYHQLYLNPELLRIMRKFMES